MFSRRSSNDVQFLTLETVKGRSLGKRKAHVQGGRRSATGLRHQGRGGGKHKMAKCEVSDRK